MMYRTNSEEASDGVRLYPEKVVFRTAEDLYFSEYFKDKEVIIKWGKSIKFDFDPDRTYYLMVIELTPWFKNSKINNKIMVPLSRLNPWTRSGPRRIRYYPIGEDISEVKLRKV